MGAHQTRKGRLTSAPLSAGVESRADRYLPQIIAVTPRKASKNRVCHAHNLIYTCTCDRKGY